ncbi:hypothetical protein PP1Y_AT15141 [Novosphingobium sp. PP1Y]|nr:hypothetical protein PP1Y_AT15141 [Novosphingobium sp. PP1Y]
MTEKSLHCLAMTIFAASTPFNVICYDVRDSALTKGKRYKAIL